MIDANKDCSNVSIVAILHSKKGIKMPNGKAISTRDKGNEPTFNKNSKMR